MRENVELLISVIIPIYKVEKYLERCVDSVINQSYSNLEIILVDDGSPDQCPVICDDYAKQDNRVKVIHKINGGLSSARNIGLDIAKGDYIYFLDSDDFLCEDTIQSLYEFLKNNDADISICSMKYVDESGREINAPMDSPILTENISGVIAIEKIFQEAGYYYVPVWNKLYRKDIFKELRFPVGRIHEDEFIVHHVFSKCKKIACTSQKLYNYVQRSDSIMGKRETGLNLDYLEAYLERLVFLNKMPIKESLKERMMEKNIYGWLDYARKHGFDSIELNNKIKCIYKLVIKYIPILFGKKEYNVKEKISLSVFFSHQ